MKMDNGKHHFRVKFAGWMLLVLCLMSAAGVLAQDDLPVITYGTPSVFTITGNDAVSFTFDGTAGDNIYMTAHAVDLSNVGAVLRIFSAKGALVAESIEVADTEYVRPVALPDTGRYTVSMQRQDGGSFTGDVNVLLDTIQIKEVTSLPFAEDGTFGPDGQIIIYSIPVAKNTLFASHSTCEQCIASFEPPDQSDWVNWGQTNRQDAPLMLLVIPGNYLFYLQNRAPNSAYHVEFASPQPIPLPVNEPVTGKIEHFGTVVFSFDSAAGKVWQINSDIPDGGRGLQIHRLDGHTWYNTEMVRDDGTGPGNNARIQQFVAPEDGRYYVLLFWQSWNDDITPRDYTVTLQPDTLRQLVPGTTFTGTITAESGNIRYLYEGKAGEKLRITLERTTDSGSPFLGVYSETDEMAVFNGRFASRVQVDVILPVDGRYQFTISDIAYDNSAGMGYTVLLEKQ